MCTLGAFLFGGKGAYPQDLIGYTRKASTTATLCFICFAKNVKSATAIHATATIIGSQKSVELMIYSSKIPFANDSSHRAATGPENLSVSAQACVFRTRPLHNWPARMFYLLPWFVSAADIRVCVLGQLRTGSMSLRNLAWGGSIPVEFTLASTDITSLHPPKPYYVRDYDVHALSHQLFYSSLLFRDLFPAWDISRCFFQTLYNIFQ